MIKKSIVGSIAILLAAGLVGCGGGGGGGGGNPGPSSFTINGTVKNGDGTLETVGDTVLFDNSNALKATTAGNGTYTIVVPAGQVTGNDNLWITDASANVLDVAPIVVNTTPLTPITTLPNSPPAQPPLARPAK
jgi:hypothetical protein